MLLNYVYNTAAKIEKKKGGARHSELAEVAWPKPRFLSHAYIVIYIYIYIYVYMYMAIWITKFAGPMAQGRVRSSALSL